MRYRLHNTPTIKHHFTLREAFRSALDLTALALFVIGVLSVFIVLMPIPQ